MTAQKVELGTIADVLNGYAFRSQEYVRSGIRIMRITNVQKGCVQDDNPKFIDISRSTEFARFMLSAGDILVSLTGNVGRVGVIQDSMLPAALNQRVAALKVSSNSRIDQRYLFYILNSDKFERDAIKNSNGIAQLNLSSKWIEKYEIPLPPLPEQKRIAKILDAADALRAKRRESLAQLDALLQSTFLEMFGDPVANPKGWEVSSIGSHLKVLGGFAFKSSDFAEQGFPVIRISNLAFDSIDLKNCARIPAVYLGKGARFRIHPGDILIAMSGATTGKLGLVPNDLREEWYLNQRVGAFRVPDSSKVSRHYLRFLLQSPFYQDHVWNLAGGAAQPNISGKQLESAEIPIPPTALQGQFASMVELRDRIKVQMTDQLYELDALFDSLQSRAFAGQL